MRKIIVTVCALIVFVSCTKEMRYTNEEIKDFPPQIQEHIKKEEIVTGMTFTEVRYSWGAPDIVNVLPPASEGQDRVEWVYNKFPFKSILRFTDGKLTEIISTEPGIAK
jgi:hypothetical protein